MKAAGAFPFSQQPSALRIQITLRDHPFQAAAQPGERSRPMAELMFDERAQLAEGLVIFGDQEQRIIAEPGRSAGLACQPPAAGSLGFEPDRSGRIGESQGAAKRRAAAVVGRFDERLEHLAIVGLVIGGLTGVPRRKDPGAPPSASTVRPESSAITQTENARASSEAFLRALPANVSASSTTSGASAKVIDRADLEPLERAGSAPREER